ncbi:MAG TPA: hypothetical protein VFT34_04570 [Verrucomicrobiae bacterium]|nr:hypothetical protein [Verrucomicrobiae bacterium]
MIERIALEGEEPPTVEQPIRTRFQVHAYWRFSQEDVNAEFESRLIAIVDGVDFAYSKTFNIKPQARKARQRVKGLAIVAVGETELRLEWRKKGSQLWERSQAVWLLKIEFTQKGTTAQSLNLPQSD